MSALWSIFRRILHDQRRALWRGGALSVIVLAMGAALLGLSGWFITAAAAAGLAGAGAVFDVFRPSAMVRFLALARAGARYGERLLTHDAVLRALTGMRVRLLAGLSRAPYADLARLRGPQALNRLIADIDALDDVTLRLILPHIAGALVLAGAAAGLTWLGSGALALWICGSYLAGAALIWALIAPRAARPAAMGERAAQALQRRLIDLLSARADLAAYGALERQRALVLAAETRWRGCRARIEHLDRQAGLLSGAVSTLAISGALWIGLAQAGAGQISPARAAMAVFCALALAEALAPLRLAVTRIGRMRDAAIRVEALLRRPTPEVPVPMVPTAPPGPANASAPILMARGLVLRHPGRRDPVLRGVDLTLRAGEMVALSGPSGAGKTTLLLALAGVLTPDQGEIRLQGQRLSDLPEVELRARLTLLAQRSALIGGSVAENLALAGPATPAQMEAALEAVDLTRVLAPRGGLEAQLGQRGSGLSGGETRRLALARAILRRPALLLADEPTEGLDPPTAARVLAGLRAALPGSAIAIVSHRAGDLRAADRVIALARGRD